MKTLLKVLAVVAVLMIAAVVVLPQVVSTDRIAARVTDRVEAATGRALTLGGEGSLRVFPTLALELNDVRFANMPGGTRPDMVIVDRLDVHIPWLSLLSGELDIDRFVINDPDILLERNASGTANWEGLVSPAEEPAQPEGEAGELPEGFDLRLGDVGISGGTLTLIDAREGSELRLENLDLRIALPSLRETLAVSGSVEQGGERLKLNAALDTPAQAIAGDTMALRLALDSRLLQLEYDGRIEEAGEAIVGSLKVSGDSLKDLAAWQDSSLEAGEDAFNRFELSGTIDYRGNTLGLKDLSARLDALSIQGQGRVVLADVPRIVATVDLGMLDLNPYLPPPAEPAGTPESGPAQPVTWDATPLDLDALKSVNADLHISSSGLKARDITLGENAFRLTLVDGLLNLALEEFQAYQGAGKGSVRLDARRSPYQLQTDFELKGVQAQPLLTDAVGFDKLSGSGELGWQLQTAGASQRDLVGGLAGELAFAFRDGAVRGANVAALVRSAEGLLEGDASRVNLDAGFDNAQQTDFSELAGSLRFQQGIGRNEDLALNSPLLRVTGEGTVNLPAAKLDYGINARLVESAEGQGGARKSKGVAIPVRIKGPFHDVKIKPDISKAAEDKVKDTLKDELFKRLGPKKKDQDKAGG